MARERADGGDPERALDRVARESETVGGSTLARSTDRTVEVDRDDPAEIWGRRVGRALSVLLALGLVWWLGIQLGWWVAP